MKSGLLVVLLVAFFAVTAFAGSAVNSYLNGSSKVCVYEDGYKVQVAITDQCPILQGH